jgi:glyoxylase-like metal-dependent hydrolase (beta-lactamase superfamily II)
MDNSGFNWLILQSGQLPLRPDRRIDTQAEHRCTVALVWPDDAAPTPDNTVLVDPCFTQAGYDHAVAQLATIGATFNDIGRMFVTHLHHDHVLHMPRGVLPPPLRTLRPTDLLARPGLGMEHCPGHDALLIALTAGASDGRAVWMVGDAILDEEWLRAWGYYWPNGYAATEIVDTWRSVARIIAGANVIVPGHGPAISVTAELVGHLIQTFADAPYAHQCPDVAESLRRRHAALSGKGG